MNLKETIENLKLIECKTCDGEGVVYPSTHLVPVYECKNNHLPPEYKPSDCSKFTYVAANWIIGLADDKCPDCGGSGKQLLERTP